MHITLHFRRTIDILKHLDLYSSFIQNKRIVQSTILFQNEMNKLLNATYDENKKLSPLLEIYSIEKEKFQSITQKQTLKEVLNWEIKICMEREHILNGQLNDYFNDKFKINPHLQLYQSYWNWNDIFFSKTRKDYSETIKSKGDFFFIFQKTGSFDEILKSNIIETYISEYEYFILSLFETPTTLKSAIRRFQREFENISEEDKDSLNQIIIILLKKLVFQTFIYRFL